MSVTTSEQSVNEAGNAMLPSITANSARYKLTGIAELSFSTDAGPLMQIGMTKSAIMQGLFEDSRHQKFFFDWVQERHGQIPSWLIEANVHRAPKQRVSAKKVKDPPKTKRSKNE